MAEDGSKIIKNNITPTFTKEQKMAVVRESSNILVSAAAGSGKTTVLVERIINKIVNEKIDIDKLLIVTFTSASASEMKERLLKALYARIDENPNDENLQRQINLLNKAHISTISSFALDVIRNNFFETNLSANFRVADENEIEIMKEDVIEEIFEKKYEAEDKNFLELIRLYTTYRDDQPLKDLILNIYDFIMSVPFPKKWIAESTELYNVKDNVDFSETRWGRLIFDYVKEQVKDSIKNLTFAKDMLEGIQNLQDCYSIIEEDIDNLSRIDFTSWDSAYKSLNNIQWADWSKKRKYDDGEKEIKDSSKRIRDEVKDKFSKKIIPDYFLYTSEEAMEDIKNMYPVLTKIKDIVLEFEEEFSNKKREKNIVDFSDIEHFALNLLINEDGSKSEIAKKYDFNEIMIDEYQDSNLVQESILNSVSNGHNIFMVGDVKQSIYRFRQARPELFLEKYKNYELIEDTEIEKSDVGNCSDKVNRADKFGDEANLGENSENKGIKIQLYKNFRSRCEILDFTNKIFQNIMSLELGEIDYEKDEYLNLGASFEEPKIDCKPELYVIDTNIEEDEKNDEEEVIDKSILEARLLCKKIAELKQNGFNYKDMVILMRSPSNVAPIYEKELIENNIPVFSDTASEYLESIEIDTMISFLKVIDNPLQDIPLISVLRSPIMGFNDNDLIEIRLMKKECPFYYAVVEAYNNKEKINDDLYEKIDNFMKMIDEYTKLEKEIPLDELIWKIYSDTGFYHYVRLMPNGKLRQANLRKLFEKAREYEKISFKGLFNFITFIEKVESKKTSNMSAAKILGENEDVVRIMSIHKSKGLEFPIVFLCNVEKRFNEQDLRQSVILDQDLGFGVNFVGDDIEYPTLTKAAIKIKNKKESVSEEMRILYVALTRAKEKLIMIGAENDASEKLEQKQIEIEKFHGKSRPNKLNENLVGKFNRYLDWIELVYEYNKDMNFDVKIVNRNELKNSEEISKEENHFEFSKNIDKAKYEKVKKLIEWKYENEGLADIPTKTSVTALKNANISLVNNDVVVDEIDDTKKSDLENLDDLINEDEKMNSGETGTLIHLALQKLENSNYNEMIDNLNVDEYKKEYLRKNKNIFENYIKSSLFKSLQDAKEVHKETPFYMNVIYKNANEKVLMQGVIDLYFLDKDNNLVLVDYKTDKNVDENMLRIRYKNQLLLYGVALKKALKRNVDKKYIYSTFLNKLVEL